MTNQKTLDLSQYTAAYTEMGQGPPIIFLHGLFGDGRTHTPLMEHLQRSYRCIGLDLLGFGRSSKPKIKYRIEHQVQFLAEFIRAQHFIDFYLVGYSFGAWVAAAFAIAHSLSTADRRDPQLPPISGLRGLTLIAPAGIRDDNFIGRYDHLKPLLWETQFVDLLLTVLTPCARVISQGSSWRAIRDFRHSLMCQPAVRAMLMERLRPDDAVDTVEQGIHRITTSTLVIAGEKDTHIPLWHAQIYAHHIAGATLKIMRGAGHDLLDTHGPEIADVIQTNWEH